MPPKKKSNKPTIIVDSVSAITTTTNTPANTPAITSANTPAITSVNTPANTPVNLPSLQSHQIQNETAAPTQIPATQDDDKKNKRRGRKPKDKFSIDDAYTEQNNSLLDFDNNIIIKLPIACKDLENELYMASGTVLYNPVLSEPKPFNECDGNNYEIIEQCDNDVNGKTNNSTIDGAGTGDSNSNSNNRQVSDNYIDSKYQHLQQEQEQQHSHNTHPPTNYIDYYQNKINDLLSDLYDSAAKKRLTQIEILLAKKYKTSKQIDLLHTLSVTYDGTKWPQSSNICCFWCCHNFANTPWGIPKKYNADTGIFTMYGVFCSPNCVLANLLHHENNNVNLWEQVSLLNLLHYKIYETDENIVPAPDNICLKMFGGPLNIQEFRALTLKNEKKYSVNFPPCVIITPVLEETKKVFNQDSYYIPIDKKRINKIQTELKIKRTNNVYKNSLENVMNISYTQ